MVLRILGGVVGAGHRHASASRPIQQTLLEAAIEQPQGMILVTGPTGSGKTTTLYALLARHHKPEVNIVTVEDPIEYQLAGINQVQVNPKAGLTFASALRSILRQDPDVILVGEMRDRETAEIACQAAMTGHMVLSTLHTNSAVGAVTRMFDLGVDPTILATSLTMVIAQRLVRRICNECREEYEPGEDVRNRVGHVRRHDAGLPRPRLHGVRRHGVLGAHRHLRDLPADERHPEAHQRPGERGGPAHTRRGRRAWCCCARTRSRRSRRASRRPTRCCASCRWTRTRCRARAARRSSRPTSPRARTAGGA